MDAAPPGNNTGDDLQEHLGASSQWEAPEAGDRHSDVEGGEVPIQEAEAVPVTSGTQQVTWIAKTWGFDGQRHFSFGVGF